MLCLGGLESLSALPNSNVCAAATEGAPHWRARVLPILEYRTERSKKFTVANFTTVKRFTVLVPDSNPFEKETKNS